MTTSDIEDRFRAAIERIGLTDRIGVAVSGGGDSMALLGLAVSAGLKPSVATVDHGLRTEARDEAELVSRYCAQSNVRHSTLRLETLTPGPNMAARARAARYDALAEWAAAQELGTILLGHTRDDQAETVLMRLARGSGADGLAAMAPVRIWASILWARPLLDEGRDELRQWLQAHGIAWAEDPTNQDTAYDRVRMRRALDDLEELGLTRGRLAGTARTMARQRAVLQAAGDALMAEAGRVGALGAIHLSRAPLIAALADTGLRVLAQALQIVSGAPYRPRLASLEAALTRIAAPDFRGAVLAGCVVVPDGDDIAICREPAAIAPVPAKAGTQSWDKRWQISAPDGAGFWIAPLGKQALAHATAQIRARAVQPPPEWVTALPVARQAVPAVFRTAEALPDDLLSVPSAGLCLDPSVVAVTVIPPDAADLRQHGSK